MGKVIVDSEICENIANTIRNKTGKQKKIKFSNFSDEINDISSGNNGGHLFMDNMIGVMNTIIPGNLFIDNKIGFTSKVISETLCNDSMIGLYSVLTHEPYIEEVVGG